MSARPCRPARWQLPGEPTLDWQSFLAKKNAELKRLNGVYLDLLNNSGVDVSALAAPAVCTVLDVPEPASRVHLGVDGSPLPA
jgi:hypothetical protein